MQDNFHRAGRQEHSVLELIVVLTIAAGCSRGSSSTRAGPDGAKSGAEPSDVNAAARTRQLVGRFDRDGAAAAEALRDSSGSRDGCGDRRAYLAVRRSAAALLCLWRKRLPMAAEASFGPEVALQEQGGAMGALDRAFEAHDCVATRAAAANLAGAFRVSEAVLTATDVPRRAIAQAVSDATYRLGQAVLESTPYVPEAGDTALVDALGFLDFVDGGARFLGVATAARAPQFDALRAATTLADVSDRASIAVATGAIGAAIRRSLREIDGDGLTVDLTYRPLDRAADIAVLTLPRPAATTTPATSALGERLFFDRRLSRGANRSCATCHVPERAYADGIIAPTSLDPAAPLRRNTPSLLYSPLQARLTWDGRVRTADRQALMVIHTRGEMGSTDQELTRLVASDRSYDDGFREAFGGGGQEGQERQEARAGQAEPHPSPTPANIGRALASFESSALVPGTAPIDRFARGDASALSADARAGFDVFVGKGRCSRCHVPPLFGGSRPPDFAAAIFAVVGAPSAPGVGTVDADKGRGDGSFRVPTLRNVGRTAPYFHHGRYPTLEQVVDFYDRGGGRGLGLDVPNQDPEVRPLHLSADDKRALLVFMRDALDDAK